MALDRRAGPRHNSEASECSGATQARRSTKLHQPEPVEALHGHLGRVHGAVCCFPLMSPAIMDSATLPATELRRGRDRGTSIMMGVSDAQFELLRW
jgi:hypothetical protein